MSIKDIEFYDMLDILKLNINDFIKGRSCFSRYGMVACFEFCGIKVHDGEYIILNISGEGCRTLETLYNNKFDWVEFINYLLLLDGHISRLDIAVDDKQLDENDINYIPILSMKKMFNSLSSGRFVSNAREINYTQGTKEIIIIGSGASDKLIRIYNKALERHYEKSFHWIRVELQLRNECAAQFFWALHDKSIGTVFGGTVFNFFRFTNKIVDNSCSHHSNRLKSVLWWTNFLESTERIKNIKCGGLIYNEKKNKKYVETQAITSIKTYIAIDDGDISNLMNKVDKAVFTPKQQMLLTERKKRLNNEIN